MSFKAKNLSYEAPTPAFLQRLKANHERSDGRNNVQHARPGGGKSRIRMGDGEDDDDGPVILDEGGEVVEKKAWEEMVTGGVSQQNKMGENESSESRNVDNKIEDGETERIGGRGAKEKQKIAEIGAAKKRKAVKVIGEEGEDDDAIGGRVKNVIEVGKKTSNGRQPEMRKETVTTKPKKKAKKIKLSFDDPE